MPATKSIESLAACWMRNRIEQGDLDTAQEVALAILRAPEAATADDLEAVAEFIEAVRPC